MEKLQEAIPAIRFPEFTDNWNNTKLSELLKEAKKRNTDLNYTKDEVLSVSGEMGIINQIEHLGRSYAGVSVHQYHIVEVGDIVYTKSPLKANPYGIIKQNKGKAGIVSTLYAVYNVKEENAHGEFIEHYFSLDANLNRYLRPIVRKGAKNTLQVSDAEAINGKMFLSTTAEQKKVTLFFNALDKKIEQLKQKKSLLEQYKKGVMQKIFSQELRFKDDNGNDFPNWDMKKLGELTTLITKGTTPKYFSPSGINFIKIECLQNGKINNKKCLFIDEITHNKELKRSILAEGDILFAIAGATIGKCNIVNKEVLPANTNQALSIIRLKENINKLFVYHNLKSDKMKKYITDNITTGAQPNLNLQQIGNYSFPFPSTDEQNKLVKFISTIDEKINRTQAQVEQTQQYKKGLLQNMFV
ncbi:restriction endonuclease subunit S [Flavobacterium sp. LB2P74]|uniref:restriction endonuclease subunit S n=1 Tax=Flavobacterium sp. LB2P74 TaxID=3401717 RepID=UPI003AAF12D2